MSVRRYPDTAVFYRRLDASFPVAVRGEGCRVFDEAGRSYLDACGGAYVVNIGHGVAEVGRAMARQAERLAYVSGLAFANEAAESLAAEVAARCAGDLDTVLFLNSGSDAVEAALKLARQYWIEVGEPRRRAVVALEPAYHGATLLALSASAREAYRVPFGDWLVEVHRAPAPYPYRCECGGEAPFCPTCNGEAVERALEAVGPGRVAAVIAEPVGGTSTGASVPPPGYWRRVREICDRAGVLLVADEVLTGVGRTGTWSALEPWGVMPDILVLGKGLAGGYAPLAAVVASRRLLDPIAAGSGALLHGQTFTHHPVSCAAGLAALRYLDRERLLERCAAMAGPFHDALAGLRGLPHIGDVRGRGLLAGIEFVADPETRAPFPREARFAERFRARARDAGLLVWAGTGDAGGGRGDVACLAPPFVIDEDEIGELVQRFRTALLVTVEETRGLG